MSRWERALTAILGDVYAQRLLGGALGALSLEMSLAVISFASGLFLARVLGVEELGRFEYTMAWVSLLAILASMGLDRFLVKQVSSYQTLGEWSFLRGVTVRGTQIALIVSVFVAVLGGQLGWLILDAQLRRIFLVGAISIPFLSVLKLLQGATRGLCYPVRAKIPEQLLKPTVSLLLIILWSNIKESSLVAVDAMTVQLIASIAAVLAALLLLYRCWPKQARGIQSCYRTSEWGRSILPLFLISGMGIVNMRIDVLMLGGMDSTSSVGIYRAASRGAALVPVVLTAINAMLAPLVASFYAKKDKEALQSIVTRGARLALLGTLPLTFGLIVWGDGLLGLLGSDFSIASGELTVLTLGRSAAVLSGPVSAILVMTSHERILARILFGSFVGNAIANAIFIPHFGPMGAALATSGTIALRNVISMCFIVRRLGLDPSVLGMRVGSGK